MTGTGRDKTGTCPTVSRDGTGHTPKGCPGCPDQVGHGCILQFMPLSRAAKIKPGLYRKDETEMTMTVIRRSDICRDVPKQWAEEYRNYPKCDGISAALAALAPEELTKGRIDAIIGNDSWTRNQCDECGEDHEVTVRLEEQSHYDERWLNLCVACLQGAARFAEEQAAPK